MTDNERHLGPPISLVAEPDFSIGPLSVRPALREVEGPDGRAVIEPRIMAVLIALASARGGVLSRDDLIARCWAGRVVSDDAVGRCIAAIRRLASELARDGFRVETIARVGYRLVEAPGPAPVAVTALSANAPVSAPLPSSQPGWRRLVPWLAGAAVVAWMASGTILSTWFPPAWRVDAGIPLLDSPRIERHIAFHPSQSMFVYSEGARIGERQIYLRRPGEVRALPVSDLPGDHSAPAWSPSGQRLAWIQNLQDQPCRILAMEFPGGRPMPVGHCAHEKFSALAWAAGEDSLYYLDREAPNGPTRVFRRMLSGGPPVAVTSPPAGTPGDVALAVRGDRLAVGRLTGPVHGEYFTLDPATGAARVVVRGAGWHGPVAWTPDGEALLIQRKQADRTRLFAVPLDGGAAYPLLELPSEGTRFALGPRGELGVEATRVLSSVRRLGVQADRPSTLEISTGMSRMPAVSSTGALALVSTRNGEWTLWLGGHVAHRAALALGDQSALQLAWSPGGDRLVIALRRSSGERLWVLDRDGRMLRELSWNAVQLGSVGWGSDGDTLLLTLREEGVWQAFWVDVATSRRTPLPGSGWLAAQATADGVLATRAGMAGLWQIGSESERVSRFPPADRATRWRVAAGRIVFPGPGPEPQVLEERDLATGSLLRSIPRESDLMSPSWEVHPGDGSVYWITGAVDTDVTLHTLERTRRRAWLRSPEYASAATPERR